VVRFTLSVLLLEEIEYCCGKNIAYTCTLRLVVCVKTGPEIADLHNSIKKSNVHYSAKKFRNVGK
jgi:hypothetical protein